jgi:hypothetical protein
MIFERWPCQFSDLRLTHNNKDKISTPPPIALLHLSRTVSLRLLRFQTVQHAKTQSSYPHRRLILSIDFRADSTICWALLLANAKRSVELSNCGLPLPSTKHTKYRYLAGADARTGDLASAFSSLQLQKSSWLLRLFLLSFCRAGAGTGT